MIVAIHQPNLFPWLGYFNKIYESDIFVFLDAVAYPKSGHSMGCYSNRVKILAGSHPCWISVPVVREPGVQPINKVRINETQPWRSNLEKTLTISYKRAKHYKSVSELLFPMLYKFSEFIDDFNRFCIQEIVSYLELKDMPIFMKQSDLNTTASSTELLIEITAKVGAHTYLCGGGASGYQKDEMFKTSQEGVKLRYQHFKHPIYPQLSAEFHHGMSIIDALFNCGIEDTRSLLIKSNI